MKRDDRRIQIGRIKMGQKALDMDDDTYRALLERVTGKRSCAQMTPAERNQVLAELARLGFKRDDTRRRGWPGRPRNVREVPMLRKVEALLADARRPWSYAHGMARRMFRVDKVEWLRDDQLHRLIAALETDARRRPSSARGAR